MKIRQLRIRNATEDVYNQKNTDVTIGDQNSVRCRQETKNFAFQCSL